MRLFRTLCNATSVEQYKCACVDEAICTNIHRGNIVSQMPKHLYENREEIFMHTNTFLKKAAAVFATASIVLTAYSCGTSNKEPSDAIITEAPSQDASYQTLAPKDGDLIAVISYEEFGDVKIKLFPNEAPKAVENFVTHAKEGYYDGLTMHRVIGNFMIQGGDPSGNGTGGESIWGEPFEDEIVEYLNQIRGSLCMANAGPDTNGSQFFITQCPDTDISAYESFLTPVQREMYETYGGYPSLTGGYTVFGQVYEGMDIVDAISNVQTDTTTNAPLEPVIISHISIETYQEK